MLNRILYPSLVILPLSFFWILQTVFRDQDSKIHMLIVNLTFLGSLLLLERARSFSKEWNLNRGDLITDAVYLIIVFPIAFFLAEQASSFFGLVAIWPIDWPMPVQFVVALLIGEFFYYWVHRFSHENKYLWKLHEFHHRSLRVYSVNSAKFSFFDTFLGAMAYVLPLKLFGCPIEVYTYVMMFGAITGYLEHANIYYNAGPLNYLFNTAELHRWHHAVPEEIPTHNFGKALSIYDWIFSTAFVDNKKVPEVGLGKEQVST